MHYMGLATTRPTPPPRRRCVRTPGLGRPSSRKRPTREHAEPGRRRHADAPAWSSRCRCRKSRRTTNALSARAIFVTARWTGEENHYPPYNIERTGEDHYQIALALAGFAPQEVSITAEQNVLTVEWRKSEKGEHQYLYQGISARPFRRVFNLADYVEVKGASFEGGLLKIDLVREVPEAMKPRRFAINPGTDNKTIEHKLAA
jgi:molecular chaperone IbpA